MGKATALSQKAHATLPVSTEGRFDSGADLTGVRAGRAEPGRQRQCEKETNDRDEAGDDVDHMQRVGDRLAQAGDLGGAEALARRRVEEAVDGLAGAGDAAVDAEIEDRAEYRRPDRISDDAHKHD